MIKGCIELVSYCFNPTNEEALLNIEQINLVKIYLNPKKKKKLQGKLGTFSYCWKTNHFSFQGLICLFV
jgi:hypothetical protein